MNQNDEDDDEILSDEELFRQQMQGVVPLKQDNRADTGKRPQRPRVRTDTHADDDPYRFADSPLDEQDYDDLPQVLSYARPGIQHSKLAKLRQGKLKVEDSIDLHGCTVAQARAYLIDFLAECREQRHTVVRIVHGKGNRSKNQMPVIKAMLNRWLREAPEVLAFHSTPQHDGGTGALYVLLKR